MAMDRLIEREDAEAVATLWLNRPAQRNALSVALMAALQTELAAIAADRSIRVVVLGGRGPAFCAGHDLKEMRALSAPAVAALFRQCSDLMQQIASLPQPVIARVHGIATAAGCQLVATADLAIAETTSRFATPGVDIGLFCSTPAVALGRAVPRKQAMEMLLTGHPIPAARAREIGLINDAVAPSELDAAVTALARVIASKSAATIALGKRAFQAQMHPDLRAAYDMASQAMAENMALNDACIGIDAFLSKSKPVWTGT